VAVTLVTPKRLNKEQRKVFEKMREFISPVVVDPEEAEKGKSFFERLFS
jgi:hypothetical protein